MHKQVEDTYLSQAVVAAGSTAAYDANVKFLLADKQILARILKYTIRECRDMEVTDIISCIGDDIEVASVALAPGLSNLGRVKEDKEEDNVPGEGAIYYDIRFNAYLGRSKTKFLINLEAQKLTGHSALGYHLENRIVYYLARMVSAQKNTEFCHSDYDSLKNVRSIWICMDSGEKGDSIEEINLERKTVYGDDDNAHSVKLMQGIIINIRSTSGEKPSKNRLIAMLEVLLSEMNVQDKKDILEKEYGMIMQVETEGRMQSMCNLSEVFIEKGILRGMKQGMQQGILELLEDLGVIPEDIFSVIQQEQDMDTLRIWHKAAARAESMDAFREKIHCAEKENLIVSQYT
ncbi:MAG: hypothetical protein NC245_14180 [Muribaculum sp.]|nr:hypothetical protein [Muribaculum sp.]